MRVTIPPHITGFWVPYLTLDPLLSGSVGAGLTLHPPIQIEENEESEIRVNGRKLPTFPPRETIEQVTGLSSIGVKVSGNADLGEGYGMSSALSLGISIYSLRKKGCLSLKEAARIAHLAEVLNMTGLGDVIAEITGGGLVLRVRPGPPGIGDAVRIPVNSKRIKVVTAHSGALTTPEMLRTYGASLMYCGFQALNKFTESPSLESFLSAAHEFSLCTGMLGKALKNQLDTLLAGPIKRGGVLGYYRKKNLLTILVHESYLEDVLSKLAAKAFDRLRVFSLSSKGLEVK
jgi:pantoate kinase